MCCDGVGCNKPDSKLDAATRIRKVEPAAAAAAAESAVGLAVQQPVAGTGVTMQQPVLIAALGSTGHPGSGWISKMSSGGSSSSHGSGSWEGGASSSVGGGGWRSSSSSSSTRDGNVSGR
jgi:hypothetical protein